MKYPCPLEKRFSWPAVSPTGNDAPYTTSAAASDHKRMCIAALGEEEGKKKTPHVHRVTLATSIMALNDGDEPTAQALCRWKTVEALRTYSKMLPTRYADVANRATKIDAGKHTNLACPEIDPDGALRRMDDAIGTLEDDNRNTARKGGARKSASNKGQELSTITQFTIDEDAHGNPVYMDADTDDDPHGIVGYDVSLPNEMWTGWERCAAKCKRKMRGGVCEQCKKAMARTTCTIVAFAESEGLYVLDAQGQHYAFRYAQIDPHFTAELKKRAQGKAAETSAASKAKRRRQ